ncbi:unnamed protein product [Blepharisma stoltei]|uniref:GRIP domain-containing protein n=1 Tax=Blepharisma stoltei TaxID=1481888 RepID=A0AAU9K9U6_9CILI|nr:unnamed protein product [Blepharisma stoltei]
MSLDYDVEERISNIKKSLQNIQKQITGESSQSSWIPEPNNLYIGSKLSKEDLELSFSKSQKSDSGFYIEKGQEINKTKAEPWINVKPELIDFTLNPKSPEKKKFSYTLDPGISSWFLKQDSYESNGNFEENKGIKELKKEICDTKAKIDELEVVNIELIKKDNIIADLKNELYGCERLIQELNIKLVKIHQKQELDLEKEKEFLNKIADLEKIKIQFSYEKAEFSEILKSNVEKINLLENENKELKKINFELSTQNKNLLQISEKSKEEAESLKIRMGSLLSEQSKSRSKEDFKLISKLDSKDKEIQDLINTKEDLKKYLDECEQRINDLEDQLLETQRTLTRKRVSPARAPKNEEISSSTMRKIIGQLIRALKVESSDQIVSACQKVIKEAKITNDSKEFYKNVVILILEYSPPNSLSKLPSVKSVLKWLKRLIKEYLWLKKQEYINQRSP